MKHTDSLTTQHNEISSPSFCALEEDQESLRTLIAEYISDGLREQDLLVIRVPTGGALSWTLPGDVQASFLEGVLLGSHVIRAYWQEAYGAGGQPASCSSQDGITGVGDPGGDCDSCPLSRWGSKENSDYGTACTERKVLYVLRPEDLLPVRLIVPTTSFKFLRAYQILLLNARTRGSGVITRFSLIRAKNKAGIPYSQVQFTIAKALPPELAQRAHAYTNLFLAPLLPARVALPAPIGVTAPSSSVASFIAPSVDDDDVPWTFPDTQPSLDMGKE